MTGDHFDSMPAIEPEQRPWPYLWLNTPTGAHGQAHSDPCTRAEFVSLLAKWNLAGQGQWSFCEPDARAYP